MKRRKKKDGGVEEKQQEREEKTVLKAGAAASSEDLRLTARQSDGKKIVWPGSAAGSAEPAEPEPAEPGFQGMVRRWSLGLYCGCWESLKT